MRTCSVHDCPCTPPPGRRECLCCRLRNATALRNRRFKAPEALPGSYIQVPCTCPYCRSGHNYGRNTTVVRRLP